MIPVVIAFLLGCCSYCLYYFEFSLYIIFAITCLCFLFSFIIEFFFNQLKKYKIHIFAAFLFGFFWINLAVAKYKLHQLPDTIEAEPIIVIGTIVSLSELQEDNSNQQKEKSNKKEKLQNEEIVENQRQIQYNDILNNQEKKLEPWQSQDDCIHFEFLIEKTIPIELWKKPGKVRLRLNHPPYDIVKNKYKNFYQIGDRWQFTVKLKKPHSYANPGSFDKERHFIANSLVAEGSVVDNAAKVLITKRDKNHFIDNLRSKIHDEIFNQFKNSNYAGILSALVVGSKDGISQEQWSVFRDTGTAHLMAISGLHVGLVASACFIFFIFIYRFLPISFYFIPARIIGAHFALFCAIFYALLAGFSVPTQRSVIMISVFMLGLILKRSINHWYCYFFALGIILLFNPINVLNPGFWLSFAAVGIILFGMKGRISVKGLWWQFGRTQWVAFLGLIPISLAIFQQTSVVSPLANIIAIPVVSYLVVPFAILGSILLNVWPKNAIFLLSISESVLKKLWPFLEMCQHLPKSTINLASFSLPHFIFASIGILFLLMPTGFPIKRLGIISLLPLFLSNSAIPELNSFNFTLLDVGQGLSAVIETKNHVLVFDTGPKTNEQFDTGDRVVLPFLASKNKNKIDMLILSHGDNDHIGGLKSILKKIPVKKIISSESNIIRKNNHFELCYAGQKWSWDGVEFEMLHPNTTATQKRNDHSCVLKVKTGQHSVLLTGDIEHTSEQLMLKEVSQQLSAQILLVPHHGSRTSSSQEFIKVVNPQYALIPVGYKNSYGHPKPDIVERYKKHGAIVLDTISFGAISFNVSKEKISKPSCYRVENKKFWFQKKL